MLLTFHIGHEVLRPEEHGDIRGTTGWFFFVET